MGLVHYSSDHLIENPVYQGSKRLHDYGYGFIRYGALNWPKREPMPTAGTFLSFSMN